MIKLVTTIVLICIVSIVQSQKTIAIIKYEPREDLVHTRSAIEDLHARLKLKTDVKHMTYSLRDSTLSFLPEISSSNDEVVADYVMHYILNLYEDYTPPLQVDRKDGNITRVYFRLANKVEAAIKVIDPETNTVLYSVVRRNPNAVGLTDSPYENKPNGIYIIPNYLELFGGFSPEGFQKNQPEKYKAILAKLHSQFHAKFVQFTELKKPALVPLFLKNEDYFLAEKIIPCDEVIIENEKAKKLKVTLSPSLTLETNEWMNVFSLDTVNGFVIADPHGWYYIDEYDNGKTLLDDAGLGGKSKEAGAAYLRGEPIYVTFDDARYFKHLDNNKEELTVGVKGGLGINYFENQLIQLDNITVIDLGFSYVVDLLRERYKKQQLMDKFLESKHIGAKYLINIIGDKGEIIDVESGTLVLVFDLEKGFDAFADEAMDIFGHEIEIIEVLNGDESKVKKVRLYSPYKFDGVMFYNVFEIMTEVVNGKEVLRPVKIAQCQGVINSASHIEEFVFTKGEKEIKEAMDRGATLRFRQKPFHFMGKTYY